MRPLLLLLLAAAPAAAVGIDDVAASSGTAVSTAAAAEAAPEAPAGPRRVLKAVIPREAADWEPVGLKAGGSLDAAKTGVVLRLVKSKGRYKGAASKARAAARSYAVRDGERLLVISVFPQALEKRRKHIELRLRVVEGYVEEAKAVLVTAVRRAPPPLTDSVGLRRGGYAFEEESASSGLAEVSGLDPRPGRSGRNAGRLVHGQFPDREVGFADVSWSVTGVSER